MLPFYEIHPSDLTVIHNARELYFRPHIHHYVEILYVYEGVQHMSIDDVSYAVQAGEAAVVFPDVVHHYFKADKKSADGLLIICEPKIFGGVFPDLQDCRPDHPILAKERIPEEATYALAHIIQTKEFSLQLGWTCVILSHLLPQIAYHQHQRAPVQDMTHKIIDYISRNFMEPITLESLAEEFNVSKYYISRVFSSKIKMNFRTYLGLTRMEYAAKLVRTTDETLTAISARAGFDSQRTFNRMFQEVYNMSPREYRHNISKLSK